MSPGEEAARAAPLPVTAGGRLRAAREAAGWSLEDVAQQLKLAPRQVQALESDDWERLPGRTFIRGFARNYARLMQLDSDDVLALLPAADTAHALERPALAPTRRPMGEMPIDGVARTSSLRWLFPLLLVAIAGAAGFYEYTRQNALESRDAPARAGSATSPAAPAQAPTAETPPGATASAPLSNPLVDAPSNPATASRDAAGTAQAATAPATPAPASAPVATGTTTATTTDAVLVLAFQGTSWAEVKDASGRVILQMTGGAGMTQTVSGTPPFELALGNAREVGVTFRGQALDLAPYTRGGVARVALK